MLWLNDRDLDIRCVRLRPHMDGARVLLDIQQVIPLPEASDYLVGLRDKATEAREATLTFLQKEFAEEVSEATSR